MKAICLLVCLALARDSAGHIFRKQYYPQMDSLNVQTLEYIDQYPQQYADTESREEQYVQHQKAKQRSQKYQPQNEKYQQQNEKYQQQNEKYLQQSEKYQQQQKKQNYQPLSQQYQQDVQYPQQQSRSYMQQQKEQFPKQWKQQTKNQAIHQTHDSTSIESNSQEMKDSIIQYASPVFADIKDLNKGLIAAHSQEMKPVYGDAISWRGVQIADGPKSTIKKEDIEKIFGEAYKTMNHVSEENKKIFHQTYLSAINTENEDTHLNATQLLNKYQYAVETHIIKTDDGYYLTLFRIPAKESTLVPRPVVFLMHGLLGSADDWLLLGPGKSLPYLLADAGYDVWLGNARGSKYSRRHVSKHPAQADFWQFGTDEVALHDLPAMIDYTLKTSTQQKLFFVGYSQGTTAFFALASERPEYNDKIIMMYAMSPMAYMSNVRSPLFRMIAPNSQFSELLHDQLGHGQFKPSKELVRTVGGTMCQNEIGCPNVCSNVNFVMSGVNVENIDVELFPVIMGHLPAGASARQVKQYAQAVASDDFTKYDFGSEINQKVYGTSQPKKYDMKNVLTPVSLYYSEEDWLAHPMDVEKLAKELPNVKDAYKVPELHFSNMDFQFSKTAPEVVYKRLIESIKSHQSQQNYVY